MFSCFLNGRRRLFCVGQSVPPIWEPGLADGESEELLKRMSRVQLSEHALVSISAGRRHVCGLTLHGKVLCWGDGSQGQKGDCGTTENTTEANYVRLADHQRNSGSILRRVRGVTAYGDTSCAWTEDGKGYCWGANPFGQAGAPLDIVKLCRALEIPAPLNDNGASVSMTVKDMSRGDGFTCLRENTNEEVMNRVRCFGRNDSSQLGIRNATSECEIAGLSGNDVVPCANRPQGWVHFNNNGTSVPLTSQKPLTTGGSTCAHTPQTDHYICWGEFFPGVRYSDFDYGPGHAISLEYEGDQIQTLTLGRTIGCLTANDTGALECWGEDASHWHTSPNGSAQFSPRQRMIPDNNGDFFPLGQVLAVTAGPEHACAIRTNREAYCWGRLYSTEGEHEMDLFPTKLNDLP